MPVGWVKRPTRGVQGRIGPCELPPEGRVARLAECRLEQKLGYVRHAGRIAEWVRTGRSTPSIDGLLLPPSLESWVSTELDLALDGASSPFGHVSLNERSVRGVVFPLS